MNIGPLEIMMIFVVALLVFGPTKLPEIARQVGRAVREFKKFQSSFQNSFQNEFKDLLEDPPPGPVVPTATPAVDDVAEVKPEAAKPLPSAPAPASGPAVPLRPVTGDVPPDDGAGSINGDGAAPPPSEA